MLAWVKKKFILYKVALFVEAGHHHHTVLTVAHPTNCLFSRLDQDSCSPVRPQLTTWLWFLSLCPCCRGAQSPRQTLGDHNSKFIYWANFLFVSSSRLQALTFTVPSGVFFFIMRAPLLKFPQRAFGSLKTFEDQGARQILTPSS